MSCKNKILTFFSPQMVGGSGSRVVKQRKVNNVTIAYKLKFVLYGFLKNHLQLTKTAEKKIRKFATRQSRGLIRNLENQFSNTIYKNDKVYVVNYVNKEDGEGGKEKEEVVIQTLPPPPLPPPSLPFQQPQQPQSQELQSSQQPLLPLQEEPPQGQVIIVRRQVPSQIILQQPQQLVLPESELPLLPSQPLTLSPPPPQQPQLVQELPSQQPSTFFQESYQVAQEPLTPSFLENTNIDIATPIIRAARKDIENVRSEVPSCVENNEMLQNVNDNNLSFSSSTSSSSSSAEEFST